MTGALLHRAGLAVAMICGLSAGAVGWNGLGTGAAAAGSDSAETATPASLSEVLQLDDLAALLEAEGIRYAAEIEAEMMPSGGGALWDRQVAALYAADAMLERVDAALTQGLSPAQSAEVRGFFGSDTGQLILGYEVSGRAAMADPDTEELARDRYDAMTGNDAAAGGDGDAQTTDGPALLAQVRRFVAANDLLERNIAGALSSNYQFFRGLSDGGALPMSEAQILQDVWSQEEEIRGDTESWLYGYLLLAYQPLEPEMLEAYIAFSETGAGMALNTALFDGFDRIYRDISYGLGRAAAVAMAGSDL